MATSKKENPVASLEVWYKLRDKAAELDRPESKFNIGWDKERSPVVSRGVYIPAQIRRQGFQQARARHTTPGSHCSVSGYQDDELQRFYELARWTAIYLGHAELKGEAARDFLVVLLKNYFLGQTSLRQEVELVGNHEGVIIGRPFKAAKIYFGHLASRAPTQRSDDKSPPVPKAPTPDTPPTNGSERSDSEINRDELTEKRREVMFEFFKRPYLKVKSPKDASRVLHNNAHLHALYELFREAEIIMIPSSAYLNITWFKLKTNKELQELYDKRIALCLEKDMRRNWDRPWDTSHQVPQVP